MALREVLRVEIPVLRESAGLDDEVSGTLHFLSVENIVFPIPELVFPNSRMPDPLPVDIALQTAAVGEFHPGTGIERFIGTRPAIRLELLQFFWRQLLDGIGKYNKVKPCGLRTLHILFDRAFPIRIRGMRSEDPVCQRSGLRSKIPAVPVNGLRERDRGRGNGDIRSQPGILPGRPGGKADRVHHQGHQIGGLAEQPLFFRNIAPERIPEVHSRVDHIHADADDNAFAELPHSHDRKRLLRGNHGRLSRNKIAAHLLVAEIGAAILPRFHEYGVVRRIPDHRTSGKTVMRIHRQPEATHAFCDFMRQDVVRVEEFVAAAGLLAGLDCLTARDSVIVVKSQAERSKNGIPVLCIGGVRITGGPHLNDQSAARLHILLQCGGYGPGRLLPVRIQISQAFPERPDAQNMEFIENLRKLFRCSTLRIQLLLRKARGLDAVFTIEAPQNGLRKIGPLLFRHEGFGDSEFDRGLPHSPVSFRSAGCRLNASQ